MSKNLIESLTPEQEAQLAVYEKRGIDIGLAFGSTDEAACEAAIDRVYTCAGLKPPSIKTWANDPLSGLKEARKFNSETSVYDAIYGQHDASWIAYYEYMREVLGLVDETEELTGQMEFYRVGHWAYTFDDAVVLVRRPIALHFNAEGQLHNPSGPAVQYPGGYELYRLNGIPMSKEQVMTPAEDMRVGDIMREPNVDVRRELLRKIGLERFIKEAKAKEVDAYTLKSPTTGKEIIYQLLDIDLGDGVTARVLKMDNPSINAMHVEGVDEEVCSTVKQALAWRNGFDTYSEPQELS